MGGLIIPVIVLAIGTYAIWSLKTLISNIQLARRTGLPVIVLPYHFLSVPYVLSQAIYKPIISRLPFGLSEWKYLHFLYMDWAFHTRNAQFAEYGDIFITASSGGNTLHVGDASVASDIMTRRVDFPKDIKFYEIVKFFGDSVLTTEGHTWRKHRKITSPPFSETVNAFVWKSTIAQTKELLQAWTSTPSAAIIRDIRSVARNVLSHAGFGVVMPFTSVNKSMSPNTKINQVEDDEQFGSKAPAGHKLPYGEALDWVLDYIFTVFIIPRWLQRIGPASWRKSAVAYDEAGLYFKELLERERKTNLEPSKQGQKNPLDFSIPKQNLLGALVATSDSAEKEDSLSEDDLIGNVFTFAVAGLETTAGTLQYALTRLAVHQDKQRWLQEELDKALADESEDPTEWDYRVVFPKLVAPMCVIHETLRLNATFQSLPKWTHSKSQTIFYRDLTYTLHPELTIFLTLYSLHSKPQYWGDSALEFHPEKWDARRTGPGEGWFFTDPKTGVSTPTTPPCEEQKGVAPYCYLRQPVKGSYLPFAEGFRQCLGKNFALVEMAALLAVLFRHHSITVAKREGETREMANKRAVRVIDESSSRITVMMREDVELKWERR